MKLRTRSASCQMSSYCCWVIGMTIGLAPRGTCVEGVFRSRSTCRVLGRASILASPSLERSRMTKMPSAGYPAFLQYLQSGRVSIFQGDRGRGTQNALGRASRSDSFVCADHDDEAYSRPMTTMCSPSVYGGRRCCELQPRDSYAPLLIFA